MSNSNKEQVEAIKCSVQIQHFLEEIVGGAAHEINNLLFIVDMSADLIETEENPEERKKITNNIADQGHKIAKIIQELRNVIKDCATEEVKDTKLTDISSHVIQLSKTRFNNHKIILKNNVPENIMVKCRENQLAQAFLAVLNSAHDSVISNKSFNRWIGFDTKINGDKLQILISDSGSKIESSESGKIFSPHFDHKGRQGLPLLIAKNVVESHGGTLEYLKDEDHNTFMITFPAYSICVAQEMQMPAVKAG
jgi:signal transduction histidine kinase